MKMFHRPHHLETPDLFLVPTFQFQVGVVLLRKWSEVLLPAKCSFQGMKGIMLFIVFSWFFFFSSTIRTILKGSHSKLSSHWPWTCAKFSLTKWTLEMADWLRKEGTWFQPSWKISGWWFQPIWNILVKMFSSSPSRDENKTYLKAPARYYRHSSSQVATPKLLKPLYTVVDWVKPPIQEHTSVGKRFQNHLKPPPIHNISSMSFR